MRKTGIAMAAVLLLAAAAARDTGAAGLGYRHGLPPLLRQELPMSGFRPMTPAAKKPAMTAEPKLVGTASYLVFELGEEGQPPFIGVMDAGANRGKGALYFDVDNDGDLAEETPLESQRWEGTENYGPIAVKLKRAGFVGLYHFCLRRYRYEGGRPDRWYLMPACYNVGETIIGGQTYRAAVFDATGNGLFNDIWTPSLVTPDRVFVDWDGDGKFGSKESFNCTLRFVREGRWYSVSTSSDGGDIQFTPAEFPMGTVTVPHGLEVAAQFLSNTAQGGFIAEGHGRIQVPADDYRIGMCWVKAVAADGVKWEAGGSRDPILQAFVREGEETSLAVGPPFTASLARTTNSSPTRGGALEVEAQLKGDDGKAYRFLRGAERMPPPKMVIRDEGGKELGNYAFQYG